SIVRTCPSLGSDAGLGAYPSKGRGQPPRSPRVVAVDPGVQGDEPQQPIAARPPAYGEQHADIVQSGRAGYQGAPGHPVAGEGRQLGAAAKDEYRVPRHLGRQPGQPQGVPLVVPLDPADQFPAQAPPRAIVATLTVVDGTVG